MSVFRDGVEIGRAPFTLTDPNRKFTLHVLTMLEPTGVEPTDPVTGRPIPRWLMVSGEREDTVSTAQLLELFKVPPEFLGKVATVVAPGTTLVLTQPAARASTHTTVADDFTVMSARTPTPN
jgi:hypothetical protein